MTHLNDALERLLDAVRIVVTDFQCYQDEALRRCVCDCFCCEDLEHGVGDEGMIRLAQRLDQFQRCVDFDEVAGRKVKVVAT